MAGSAAIRRSQLLFVYGSLKQGRANHHLLHAAEYVSRVRTAPRFALRVVQGYPALVSGSRSIVGELYRLPANAFRALDEFEGPDYVRQQIELEGRELVQAYLSRVFAAGAPFAGDEWPSPAD